MDDENDRGCIMQVHWHLRLRLNSKLGSPHTVSGFQNLESMDKILELLKKLGPHSWVVYRSLPAACRLSYINDLALAGLSKF